MISSNKTDLTNADKPTSQLEVNPNKPAGQLEVGRPASRPAGLPACQRLAGRAGWPTGQLGNVSKVVYFDFFEFFNSFFEN